MRDAREDTFLVPPNSINCKFDYQRHAEAISTSRHPPSVIGEEKNVSPQPFYSLNISAPPPYFPIYTRRLRHVEYLTTNPPSYADSRREKNSPTRRHSLQPSVWSVDKCIPDTSRETYATEKKRMSRLVRIASMGDSDCRFISPSKSHLTLHAVGAVKAIERFHRNERHENTMPVPITHAAFCCEKVGAYLSLARNSCCAHPQSTRFSMPLLWHVGHTHVPHAHIHLLAQLTHQHITSPPRTWRPYLALYPSCEAFASGWECRSKPLDYPSRWMDIYFCGFP